jgi:mono/diheme cytochrome c family protein
MIDRAQMLSRHVRQAPAALAIAAPVLLAGTAVGAFAAAQPTDLPGNANEGRAIYGANCVVCHGVSLQGGIGKRLNPIQEGHDNAGFITATVTDGVKGTQMPAWGMANGGSLDQQQIDDVAAFILTSQHRPTLTAPGPLTLSTIAWVAVGVLAMVVATFLLARFNMRWIRRRSGRGRLS